MVASETKQKILDEAERLFSERHYSTVTLREITSAARVNIASVNYHFGSKSILLREVFRRRALDLNRERLNLLDTAEREAAPKAPSLEAVLFALAAPPIRWSQDTDGARARFMRFLRLCRVDATEEIRTLINNEIGHLQRFLVPLARILPQLSRADLCWSLHHSLGVIHEATAELDRLARLSDGVCHTDNSEEIIARVVGFCAAGFLTADNGQGACTNA